jgi:hypothetical protein
MKKSLFNFCILILTSFISGCSALTGEEVARLSINKLSTSDNNLYMQEAKLNLKKGETISFWSDMDMEYTGDVELRFKVEILKNETSIGILEINPTEKNITLGEVKTTIMDKTTWRFQGKNSQIEIEEDAAYRFKAILVGNNNSSLVLSKAELVLKK